MNERKLIFRFREFSVQQHKSAMKVGTDAVLLGAWANLDSDQRILDIGTGTGLIALMVAQRYPGAAIHGIEPETGAFGEASDNFRNSPWPARLSCSRETLRDHQGVYDHAITNPPFFPLPSATAERTMARSSVHLSAHEILQDARRLLTDIGRLSIILPVEEGTSFLDQAPRFGFFPERYCTVYSDKDKPVRRLMTFGRQPVAVRHEKLFIRWEGKYSKDYIALTRPFYLSLSDEMD